jgi:hypothetical protein
MHPLHFFRFMNVYESNRLMFFSHVQYTYSPTPPVPQNPHRIHSLLSRTLCLGHPRPTVSMHIKKSLSHDHRVEKPKYHWSEITFRCYDTLSLVHGPP